MSELSEALKNRDAGVGLLLFSVRIAPAGIEPFVRYGDDIVVAWDAEDPRTAVALVASLSVAKALSARSAVQREAENADFDAIDRAILEIEQQTRGLDEITRVTQTILGGSDRILDRSRIMREALLKQIGFLGEKVADLRSQIGTAIEA